MKDSEQTLLIDEIDPPRDENRENGTNMEAATTFHTELYN